ncbi:hypothetical protein [Methylobacterium frigidaeris]|uniref:Phospholipase A2 domain-containing protein n=1 Tax=Methylobacterium frigidaeris TaxID=2038277 RepID=A0AA37M249_9HYPH|nr:hypothetical protein [Methylobacterium frigidaeris]PIK72672.1 hypothetical protein CS379_12670 [Methylobacterium frigidaeris]GJD60070.1 hypothetical protein MPEAHAMD_0203 [Methylobacterium frigidaeris]
MRPFVCSRLVLVAGLLSCLAGAAGPAAAQDLPFGLGVVPDAVMPRDSLVFHGNYCGPGSRGAGRPPIDALDAACMRHDACTPPRGQGLPTCSCHARLQREAEAVARSPRYPDDLRSLAGLVSAGATQLPCR